MPRTATTLLVLALLTGSAVSFAVSERLKLEESPISDTRVDKVFSPVCGCSSRRAIIGFRLRRSDRLWLSVIDEEGKERRRLVDGRRLGAGFHRFAWNGRDDAGALVPEGRYRPKVELDRARRTIVLPNPIRVDRTRPRVIAVRVEPRAISPDGDGRGDRLVVRYRLSERAHALLYVNGKRRVWTRLQRPVWQLAWYGRVGERPLPPGLYRLSLAAVDLAGNVSRRVGAGVVRIRYVAVRPRLLQARPGERLRLVVDTDAASLRYILRRASSVVATGVSSPRLSLRAPRRPGRYLLTVEAAGHRARALVLVARR
ncbi:MAG: hypothetical protein C4306_03695 [Thermoleophilia bacterium]